MRNDRLVSLRLFVYVCSPQCSSARILHCEQKIEHSKMFVVISSTKPGQFVLYDKYIPNFTRIGRVLQKIYDKTFDVLFFGSQRRLTSVQQYDCIFFSHMHWRRELWDTGAGAPRLPAVFFSSLRNRTKCITANSIWSPILCRFENVKSSTLYHAQKKALKSFSFLAGDLPLTSCGSLRHNS